MSTSTGWLDSASTPTVHVYIRFVVVVVHVEQRNIQMLSFPSPVAVAQGRNNRQSRMHARADISHADEGNVGCIIRLADHRGDARVSLSDVIIAGFVGQRSTLAKSRDRAQNDTGSQLLQSLISQ